MENYTERQIKVFSPIVKVAFSTKDTVSRKCITSIIDDDIGFAMNFSERNIRHVDSVEMCVCYLNTVIKQGVLFDVDKISSDTAYYLYEFITKYFPANNLYHMEQYNALGKEYVDFRQASIHEKSIGISRFRKRFEDLPLMDSNGNYINEDCIKVDFYRCVSFILKDNYKDVQNGPFLNANSFRVWLKNISENDVPEFKYSFDAINKVFKAASDVSRRKDEFDNRTITIKSNEHLLLRIFNVTSNVLASVL